MVDNAIGSAGTAEQARAKVLTTPAIWFLVAITAYFALQTVLRVLYAPSISADDAELLITTQSLDWGHGTQPPLYNWIQIAAFRLLGVSVFALSAIKNLLMWVIFAAGFFVARRVVEDDRKAVIAALCLFLIPQIGWEFQRALTHSVIVLAMIMLTLLALLRVLQAGRTADYALLGVAIGLGCLAKYNFIVGVVAMLACAVTIAELRPRIIDARLLLSLAIAALIVSPHILWTVSNMETVLSRASKFEAEQSASFSLTPLVAVAEATFQSVVLPCAIFLIASAIAWFRGWRPNPRIGRTPIELFFIRLVPVGLGIILVGAMFAGVGEFKERWLITVTFAVPLALFLLTEDLLGRQSQKAIGIVAAACAVLAGIGLGVMYLLPRPTPPEPNRPLPAIAQDIRAMGYQQGTIIAGHTRLAGAMKLEFPDSQVVEPQYQMLPRDAAGPLLLAWTGDKAVPSEVSDLYRQTCGADLPAVTGKELSARYLHSSALWRVNVVLIGGCTVSTPVF